MKNFMLAVLAVAVIVLGVLYVRKPNLAGGGGDGARHVRADENNLSHVKCNSNNPDHPGNVVEIPVNSTVGLDYPDKITFGCKDEKVHWKIADSGVDTFTVTFVDSPFSPPQTTLQPDPTTGLTQDQLVKHINTKYEIDAYTLVVTKKDGSKIMADPHFIPMGP